MRTTYHDFDTDACVPNAGKNYASPKTDPFLRPLASKLSTISAFFATNYPNDRFYLSVLDGHYSPDDVQSWPDDIWLFPHYVDDKMAPFDVRENGPAAGGWWGTVRPPDSPSQTPSSPSQEASSSVHSKMAIGLNETGDVETDSSLFQKLLPLWLTMFFGGIATFVWLIWNSRRKGH